MSGLNKIRNPVVCIILINSIIVLISLACFMPKACGIFFPQDEFGYWGNAARLTGYDWSELLAKQSSYAYGYSLLLLPLMRVFSKPILMYKAALCLNVILTVVASGMISGLILRLDKDFERSKMDTLIICLISSLFPPLLIYMHYTIAESLIFVEFYALCHVMLDISDGRIDAVRLISGGVIGLIMILTHYRTVGLLFIFFVCVILSFLFGKSDEDKNKQQRITTLGPILFAVLMTVAMFVCGHIGIYFGKREYDLAGLAAFAAGIIGKLLYIGCSTFGLGLIGVYFIFKERSRAFNFFIMLGLIYMIFLGSFYFSKAPAFVRLDHIIYGRYDELFIPLLIYFGLSYMLDAKRSGKVVMGTVIIMGAIAVLLTFFVNKAGITEYVRDFVSGVDWMFLGKMPMIADVYERPFIIASIGLGALYYFLNNKGARAFVMSLVVLIFIAVAFFMTYEHVYTYQEMDASDLEISDEVKTQLDNGKKLYFLDSPYNDYINLMQFWLMDTPIHITEGLDANAYDTPPDAVVITHSNYEDPEQLLKRYSHNESSAHFVIYYN